MAGEPRVALLVERGVTRREADVLAALGDRLTNAEIAASLYLSVRTVESHVTALLRKLDARNRVALGDLAHELLAPSSTADRNQLPAPLELLADAAGFVGRDFEVARLRGLWRRAGAGQMLVGVVAGDAGIGKSRLVAEFAAETHRSGAQVLWGGCFEDQRVPYHPFVQLISADVATLREAELRRRAGAGGGRLAWLVPELAAATRLPVLDDVDDPASAQAEIFASLHGYLVRSADAGPLLVVIEDVHWATSTTLGALRHLARVSGPARLVILITTRDHPPDIHPDLATFLSDLDRLPAVDRIELAGLAEGEIAALLAAMSADADAATVLAHTGGNPLFVREVGRRGSGPIGPLQGLLDRRYALLDGEDLVVVDLAAVLGVDFDADLLALAARRPLPEILEALERAESAGLVARDAGRPGHFSFVHALFRAARYDDMPEARRIALHRQIAGALRSRADDDGALVELARHVAMAAPANGARDGLDRLIGAAALAERARRSLRDSGDRALALNDYAAAGRDYEGALRLWPPDDRDRPAVLLGLGKAMFTRERHGAAVLREARDGLLAIGDDEGAAEAELMLGELEWIASRWDEASAHFDQAASLVRDRPPSAPTARVIAGLARFRMIAGDASEALQYGDAALAMARALGARTLEANVLISLGPARFLTGDLGGIADITAGVDIAASLESPEVGRGYANLAYVHGLLGDVAESRAWRRRARDAADRFGLASLEQWSWAHDIEDQFLVGHWDDALAEADAFLAAAEASAHYLVTVCLRVRSRVRLGRGNPIGGMADAAAAVEFARGAQHPSNLLVALIWYARCLSDHGRRSDAEVAVTAALKDAVDHENNIEPIGLAIVMSRLGRQAEFLAAMQRMTIPSRRKEIGCSIARGDLTQAAEALDSAQLRTTAADVRLLAVEQFSEQGRQAEAEIEARRALAFLRSVGAAAYVERGERLVNRLARA